MSMLSNTHTCVYIYIYTYARVNIVVSPKDRDPTSGILYGIRKSFCIYIYIYMKK